MKVQDQKVNEFLVETYWSIVVKTSLEKAKQSQVLWLYFKKEHFLSHPFREREKILIKYQDSTWTRTTPQKNKNHR